MTGMKDAPSDDSRFCGGLRLHGTGPPCRRPAGWGTPHPGVGKCKLHGGKAPSSLVKADRIIAARATAEAVDRLGLVTDGTNGAQALQEALDRCRANLLAWAIKVSTLEPAEWKQRDASGKFERPSVWVEGHDRALELYAKVARDCVALGIAAQTADVARRDAEQVIGLLRAFVEIVGLSWDAPEVKRALIVAVERQDVG